MSKIYLDNAATTPLDSRVFAKMEPYFTENYGNASSIHAMGQAARVALQNARETVAQSLHANPGEIIFTAGGTESDNLALVGAALREKTKRHIITSAVEHPAVLDTCHFLERQGFQVTYVPVSAEGQVGAADVAGAITDDTFLISIMHANNETGAINPIAEIGTLAHEKKILFHSDAVQTFGKMPINIRKLPVDLLSVCAHKIYGPKGVGALYVRKGVQLEPLLHGGHQENTRRAGTENIPAIVGFAEAVRLSQTDMAAENLRIRELRELLWEGIRQAAPGCQLNGPDVDRLAGHLNIAFPGVEGNTLLLALNARGICASSGSACTTGTAEPSHVLRAMGLSKKLLKSSVRLTLGRFTTEAEIHETIRVIPELVNQLKRLNRQKR